MSHFSSAHETSVRTKENAMPREPGTERVSCKVKWMEANGACLMELGKKQRDEFNARPESAFFYA